MALDLSDVTLCAADSVHMPLTARAMHHLMEGRTFADVEKLLTIRLKTIARDEAIAVLRHAIEQRTPMLFSAFANNLRRGRERLQ